MAEDIICGLNAVAALFERRSGDVRRLFYTPAQRLAVGEWCRVLASARKPYRMVEPADLAEVAGTTHHGGVAAVAAARKPAIFQPLAVPRHPFLLVLEGIGNPHNLGAIARSAAFFGVPAMLMAEAPGNAALSDAAYRTSGGGLEWLDLYRTRDLPAALVAMGPHYRTVAATLDDDAAAPGDIPRDRPMALVLGNEERGIGAAALAACRRTVRIPGSRHIQSLNVAQAAAVLMATLAA